MRRCSRYSQLATVDGGYADDAGCCDHRGARLRERGRSSFRILFESGLRSVSEKPASIVAVRSRSAPKASPSCFTTAAGSRCGYFSFSGMPDSFITTLSNFDQPTTTACSYGVPWKGRPRWSMRMRTEGNSRIYGSKPGAYRGSKCSCIASPRSPASFHRSRNAGVPNGGKRSGL